jgi:FAD/FMN-containing dehydrogenase
LKPGEIIGSSDAFYNNGDTLARMPTPDLLAIDRLRDRMRGNVLCPEDSGYDDARRLWNGMIDRRPLLIARCLGLTDVVETIRFSREHDIPMTVRGGGHGVSGKAVLDQAVLLDLSSMKHVQVDPVRQRALAHAGATWGDFDPKTQACGLATTGGVISTTGIAGLTLGGGIGWLMGKHGLACDNLISVDVADATGKHLTASAEQNADLFWAIRGGGGNFGVVTTFEYQLHPLAAVLAGILLHPRQNALDLLRHYRDLTANAPDELTAYAGLMSGPDGTPLTGIALCHSADDRIAAENDVGKFRRLASPIADMVGWKSYADSQTMMDFTAPKGLRYYFKCAFLAQLPDEALQTILHYGESTPSPQTQIVLEHVHGKASRVPPDASAFALRRNQYSLNIVAGWQDPAMTDRCVAWVRAFAASMDRFGTGDTYVNYLGEEGPEAVHATYGGNYERLAKLKLKYDPDNFFRFNQNIAPSTATSGQSGPRRQADATQA